MKRRTLVAATAMLASIALWVVPAGVARADSSCPDFYACFWNDTNFTDGKRVFGAGDAGHDIYFDHTKYSIKNHFSNRAILYRTYGELAGRVYCINPSTHAAWPYFAADVIYIGGSPSHC